MKTRLSQPDHKRLRRTAFTLVELLVAMTIFVLLATITVTGFRGSDSDRVSNAAAAFKNALEGAKSRAVKSGETRGLRLILSPTNGREVTSFIYVNGGNKVTGELRFEYNNSGVGPYAGKWHVQDSNDSTYWNTLNNNTPVPIGTRFQSPKDIGTWFTIIDKVTYSGSLWWVVAEDVESATPDMTNGGSKLIPSDINDDADPSYMGLATAVASDPVTYSIQIAPTILAGAEPIALPPNTCIDLDGSKVPNSWRPNPPGKTVYGSTTEYMDILFTPQGTVARPLTTEGILHFRIASSIDMQLWNSLRESQSWPAPFYNPLVPPNSSRTKPLIDLHPERGAKLVSIMAQTGSLVNAEVYQSKLDPPNEADDDNTKFIKRRYDFNDSSDEVLPTPYRFVLYGKESK